jgi:NAD(P)-dependent dehydrogenase (short-subunit alcohol dehydrogenase family)
MSFDLKEKVVLVAGGAGYLGHGICLELAAHGAVVVIADLSAERGESLALTLRNRGRKAAAVVLNVADESSVKTAIATTLSAFGRLDCVVNATCYSLGLTLDELTADEFDRSNRVNITGAFLLAREAARVMEPGSSIVLFASMYGLVSPDPTIYEKPMNPNPMDYGVGKAAVVQMTKYLAVFWGPKGIRVNAISPGPFPNPTVQKEHPQFIERLAKKVPLGRVGRADEISGAVVYLASDASTFMNGNILKIDGGWTVM